MALKPPSREQGVVTRGVLQDALKKQRKDLETGEVRIPVVRDVPTGTGFRHVTNGAEDPAAKLVDTADINNSQVTYVKMQESSAESVLIGRGEGGGAGPLEEITLGTNLSMTGNVLNAAGGGGGSGMDWLEVQVFS